MGKTFKEEATFEIDSTALAQTWVVMNGLGARNHPLARISTLVGKFETSPGNLFWRAVLIIAQPPIC